MGNKRTETQAKYDAKNAARYTLKFNRKTDPEIIAKLETVESVNAYIKGLIKNDIQKQEEKKMKDFEIVEKFRKAIAAEMIEKYRVVLNCSGRIQYKIYVWEDGEIESLEQPQGDTGYLKARDSEPRQLVYVATVSAPCFDPWDFADHSAPDSPEERETAEQAIIDSLVDGYRESVPDIIDNAIEQLQY